MFRSVSDRSFQSSHALTAQRKQPSLLASVSVGCVVSGSTVLSKENAGKLSGPHYFNQPTLSLVSEIYTEETTTVERPPDAKLSQWLLERKWPELFSRKHIEVSATVKSEDPSPPMRLIVIDQLETPPVPVGENEKGPEPDAPAPEADTPGLAGEDDD